jgi:hypothetical protein
MLFAALVIATINTTRRLKKFGGAAAELQWIRSYARMFQASIVGYLVTGAFMSVAYFDLAYHVFTLVVVLKQLAAEAERRVPAAAVAKGATRGRPVAAVDGSFDEARVPA